jgi:hypothetical protein
VRKVRDGLGLSVDSQFEVSGGQILYVFAFFVGNRGIHLYKLCADADYILTGRAILRRGSCARKQHGHESENDGAPETNHFQTRTLTQRRKDAKTSFCVFAPLR